MPLMGTRRADSVHELRLCPPAGGLRPFTGQEDANSNGPYRGHSAKAQSFRDLRGQVIINDASWPISEATVS